MEGIAIAKLLVKFCIICPYHGAEQRTSPTVGRAVNFVALSSIVNVSEQIRVPSKREEATSMHTLLQLIVIALHQGKEKRIASGDASDRIRPRNRNRHLGKQQPLTLNQT